MNTSTDSLSNAPSQQQQSTNVGAQDMYNEFIGAIKIRDGLFIGDQLAAQDYEFVITNKVTHIINTSGLQIRNYWESIGVKYLTFDWVDQDCQIILDANNNNANKIYNFIEEAYEQGESCLVHSLRGQSRASTVLAAYFMKKFKWSLYKTIEFLNNRRPDLEIRASFIRQLSYYEKRLLQETGVQSDAWTELASKPHLENDELILTHTFLNAQMGPFADFSKADAIPDFKDSSKLKWLDERESKKDILVTNFSKDDLLNKENITKITTHHNKEAKIKSIIKVPYDQFYLADRCDTDEGELLDQKHLITMDTKTDEEGSREETIAEFIADERFSEIEKEKQPKPFEYNPKSKDDSDKKSKDEPKKPRFLEEKPRHKISSSVDKGRLDQESKSLNFKTKKYSENSSKTAGNVSTSLSNNLKETTNRLRQSIKKDSIKLKNKIRTSSNKRQKSKEGKKRRRPRSNDDRKKEKSSYPFDNLSNKRSVSRGVSDKANKEAQNNDVYKRRNIVNKFVNNSHMLVDQSNKIDSRNIYTNSHKQKKNWNSTSLNLKKFVKKKDLNMVYPLKKDIKKKSQDTKLKSFQNNSMTISADNQFKSFLHNEKQFLVNPYFSNNTDFSKSFGSSIYKPTSASSTSGQKLAALKNCLIMNTYSGKNADSKTSNYVTTKAMKKIEKKSIKFAMKNQNLTFNEKTNSLIRPSTDKPEPMKQKKKRSVSPISKGGPYKYTRVKVGSTKNGKFQFYFGCSKYDIDKPGVRATNPQRMF